MRESIFPCPLVLFCLTFWEKLSGFDVYLFIVEKVSQFHQVLVTFSPI